MGDVEHDTSRIVSRSLDSLGYNQDIVKYRIQHYRDDTIKRQEKCNGAVKGIYAGSKGEGTTSAYESDYDTMFVYRDIVCSDNIQIFSNCTDLTIFKMDRDESYPGYTRLKLEQFKGRSCVDIIVDSLFESEFGDLYISSDLFRFNLNGSTKLDGNGLNDFHVQDTSGPSQPFSADELHFDFVISFCCYCPDILQSWTTRPRYYNWPTPQIIYDISQMEAHVVPVGFKGSENSNKEWRICFTKAELHLIQNLNDTQTKLYVLLKLVAKIIIKPICDEVTSYVMTNVVLWMAEYNPEYLFGEELLIERLVQALVFLKSCVKANYLPNYMIPDRNLLAGRLSNPQRRQLVTLLSELIHERGRLLQRCERLRRTMEKMYVCPDVAVKYGKWRNEVEILFLYSMSLDDESSHRRVIENLKKLLFDVDSWNFLVKILS